MGINLVKVRAEVSVGSLTVSTPFVQSFNVRKTRNQLSTFDVSLKIAYAEISGSNTGGAVSIKAGKADSLNQIYTGIAKHINISPCWDDPGYVILSVSGTDVLSLLENKKYTRRCRATKSSWVTINKVERQGLRSGKFSYVEGTVSLSPDSALLKSVDIVNKTSNNSSQYGKQANSVPFDPIPLVEVSRLV